MPKKFKLYWDKNLKYWFKKFDGKKVYFGRGKSKYLDKESYDKAVSKYEQYLYDRSKELAKDQRKENFRYNKNWLRPEDTIAGAIDRYYRHHSERQKRGEIGISRLATIKTNLSHLEDFLGKGSTTKIYQKDGVDEYLNKERMDGYFRRLTRLVEEKKHTQATAQTKWCSALDFLKFCYEQEWLDKMPRGLNRLKFNPYAKKSKSKTRIKTYSVSQVRDLFLCARDNVRQPLDLYIALALNFGFTSIDISTMTHSNLIMSEDGKRIVRVRKERTKTGQIGEWKVWKVTDFLIRDYFKRRRLETSLGFGGKNKNHSKFLFRGRDGQPLNQRNLRVDVGIVNSSMYRQKLHSNDSIGRCFKSMMEKNLPELENLGFKNFRKCGATEIVKLNLNNSLLIEQLYLNHKPQSVARKHYSNVEFATLDTAMDELEKIYRLDEIMIPYEQKRRGKILASKVKKEVQRRRNKAMRTHLQRKG